MTKTNFITTLLLTIILFTIACVQTPKNEAKTQRVTNFENFNSTDRDVIVNILDPELLLQFEDAGFSLNQVLLGSSEGNTASELININKFYAGMVR